jgi:hypothetical protein
MGMKMGKERLRIIITRQQQIMRSQQEGLLTTRDTICSSLAKSISSSQDPRIFKGLTTHKTLMTHPIKGWPITSGVEVEAAGMPINTPLQIRSLK